MKYQISLNILKLNRKTIFLILCMQIFIATSLFAYENMEIEQKIAQFEQGLSSRSISATMQSFKKDAVWQGFKTYPYVEENVAELFKRYKSINLIRNKLEFLPYDQRIISSADYHLQAVTMQGETVELPVSFIFLWENTESGWEIIAINPLMLIPVDGSVEEDLKMLDTETHVITPALVPDKGAAAGGLKLIGTGTTIISNTAGPHVLHPIADSYVYAYTYRNWDKSNRGAYNVLTAGWHPTGGESRAYLKFDLSSVDANNVGKATLRLFHYHTGGNNSLAIGVYVVTGRWQEGSDTYHSGRTEKSAAPGEISWVHQPSFDPRPVARFNPGPGVNKWVEVDITPLVKAWLSGTPNYGLIIKPEGNLSATTPEAQYNFYSKEHKENDKQPVLEISTTLDGGISGKPYTYKTQMPAGYETHFHSKISSEPEQQTILLAGRWVDKNGHNVTMSQSGQNMTAIAEENKGPVGWKIANGVLKGNTVYMNFKGWNLTGNVSSQGNKISWSNNSVWTRISSSSTDQNMTISDSGKYSNTFDKALVLPCAPDRDFVRSLYHCILHREPSTQEIQGQVSWLQRGTLRQQMVTDFFLSPEYENMKYSGTQFITDACQAIYARQPTEAELRAWPRTSRRTIIDEMFKKQAHLMATQNCSSLWRHSTAAAPTPTIPASGNIGIDNEPIQDSTASQAYKEYMDAYNAMAKLMAAGKGDTPEGRKAYTDFAKAKEKYETWLTNNPPNKGQADF